MKERRNIKKDVSLALEANLQQPTLLVLKGLKGGGRWKAAYRVQCDVYVEVNFEVYHRTVPRDNNS